MKALRSLLQSVPHPAARRGLLVPTVIAVATLLTLLVLAAPAGQVLAQNGETTGNYEVWLHENVFPESDMIDTLFNMILYMTMVVGTGVFVVLAIFLVKYRHQPGRRARFTHGNPRLEIVWTLVPTLIMALTAAFSQATWSKLKFYPPADGSEVRINILAQQFAWNYHYPGKDGKFGRIGAKFRNNSGDLKARMGLDPDDPNGKDDFITSEMVVPVGTKVFAKVTSIDVLHSFYLPNFRVKQDAVPGMMIDIWFQSTKTSAEVMGVNPAEPLAVINPMTGASNAVSTSKPFDVVCAELCGAGHYTMRGKLFVLPQSDFERYVELHNANVAATQESGGGDAFE